MLKLIFFMEEKMQKIKLLLFSIFGSIFIFGSILANAVEIEYWQYTYKASFQLHPCHISTAL